MKQKFTRHVLRLLMLFAGLFALSNVGWAYTNYTLVGSGASFGTNDHNFTWNQSANDNKGQFEITNLTLPSGYQFKIKCDDDWYGAKYNNYNQVNVNIAEGGNFNLESGKNGLGWASGGDDWWNIVIQNGGKYSFYLQTDNGRNGKPINLYIVREKGGLSEVRLVGLWPEHPEKSEYANWEWADGVKMTKSGDNFVYTYASVHGSEFLFRPVVDQTQYGPQNGTDVTVNTNGTKYGTQVNEKGKSFKFVAKPYYTYTITYYPSTNQVSVSVKQSTTRPQPSLANDTRRAGKVYLVGNVLNNNTPSPAWEMIESNGTYVLDSFAMRYTNNLGVVKYSDSGVPQYYDQSTIAGIPTEEVGGAQKGGYYSAAGWKYKATWNGSTLTLTPSSFNVNTDIMPYVGILGEKFKQSERYDTPISNTKGQGNTNLGWQEAYIEYGTNGAPLLRADGKAYYNTVWPPKNNIMLQAELTENNVTDLLNVSSNELTLRPDAIGQKTGSEWKTYLKGKYPERNYDNLNLPSGTYVRYVVDNMWMQGNFKIWTGWGGQEETWGANWDTHIYWGPTGNANDETVDKVKTNQLYSTSNLGTDYNFKSPGRSFYRTMELFIPVNSTNGFNFTDAKLYCTAAMGGAQIDAKATNKSVFYMPSLKEMGAEKVTSYTVTRYAYNASVKADEYATKLNPCNINRGTVSKNAARVKYGSNVELSVSEFDALFAENQTAHTLAGFKYDNEYAPGRYIFRLEVTFTNGQTADVWSPYVEILDTEYVLPLEAYQLVQLPAGQTIGEDGNYITYDENGDYKWVKLNGDNVEAYDDLEDTSEVDAILRNGTWTNKALLISSTPSLFETQGESREVTAIAITNASNLKSFNNGENYVGVVNRAENIANYDFEAKFTGTITKFDGTRENVGTSKAVTAKAPYKTFIPTPIVKEARVEYFDGETNSPSTDGVTMNFNFTSTSGETYEISSARYHNVREIVEVVEPNVSDDLKKAANGAFSYYFERYVNNQILDNEPVTIENGSMPTASVKPSTLFVASASDDAYWDYKILKRTPNHSNLYERGWNSLDNEGKITSIAISTNPPIKKDEEKAELSKVKIKNMTVLYEPGTNHLVGLFDLYVEMESDDNDNEVEHKDKDQEDTIEHGTYENADYFFITLNDKETGDVIQKGFKKDDNDSEYAEYVVSVASLGSKKVGNDDDDLIENDPRTTNMEEGMFKQDYGNGFTMTVRKDFGIVPNNWASVSLKMQEFEDFIKSIQMRISYLYPFYVEESSASNLNGKTRMKAMLEGDVIKSDATAWELASEATRDGDMMTSVEGIGVDSDASLKVGRGFIEVEGDNVEIYSASGMHIGRGAGRYDVAAGIYMVNLNGQIRKVLVK